ncbi:hypothetical protein TNCV_4533531 [Trichonephila clavipes]|nr:hypothetical protein TNCV_4533531 [Trichonephila clavipes]
MEWCSKSSVGRDSTQDASRSGRPSTFNADENKRAINHAISGQGRSGERAGQAPAEHHFCRGRPEYDSQLVVLNHLVQR